MTRAGAYILFLSMATLIVGGCKGKNKATGSDGTQDSAIKAPLGGVAPADSLFFSIERTPCFGFCPTYRASIYRSGLAIWEGMDNVERMGMHKARAGEAQMRGLLDDAERIGFFTLQEKYDGPVTDIPSTFLRVVSGERDHTVMARYRVPQALRDFSLRADSLLSGLQWVAQEDQDR